MRIELARGVIRPNTCSHGPQSWPWWRIASFDVVALGPFSDDSKTRGIRLWVYTRWAAFDFDIYLIPTVGR